MTVDDLHWYTVKGVFTFTIESVKPCSLRGCIRNCHACSFLRYFMLCLTVSYLVCRIFDGWFVYSTNCKTIQEFCKMSLEAETACGRLCVGGGTAKASCFS